LSIQYLKLNLCTVGLLVGTVFFAFSLTPSLLPRPFGVQGVISGLSFTAGYGSGVAGLWVWNYLQLPMAGPRTSRIIKISATVVCLLIAVSFLWQAATWQNSIRELMGMEESSGVRPAVIGVIAALLFIAILMVTRFFWGFFLLFSKRLARYIPPRISHLMGIIVSVLLFWSVINGVLVKFVLETADQSFQQLDALIEDHLPRPFLPQQTGSPSSLITWQDLGRQGRRFISSGPGAEELSDFFGTPLPSPLRVYVGLNSAETAEQRARLALEELKRVRGFERSVLLLVTPTGTGWIDPASQNPVEYLFRGDIATVAVQYSYLNSPLALLTEGAYGAEAARAVFTEIYNHWRSLPRDSRPRLFLSGLSLGSLNSDRSFDLFDIIDDPFHGALWSGPTFRNDSWRRMTQQRKPESPAWLPQFRDGSVVRFMNQTQDSAPYTADWGDFRIVFLQYASDPVTFFDPQSAWREPDWMREPRGPDVSPNLRWFPVVTMLQLLADMMVGTAPPGFGHEYAATDYIDAWLTLTEPEGWSESEIKRLRRLLAE
jgi:uncharacterized membrane protein